MKEIFIKDLYKDQEFEDLFLVKSIASKTDKNDKIYYDIMLGDNSGEISAKKWNLSDKEISDLEDIKDREVVKVKGQVMDFSGQLQMKIYRIRAAKQAKQSDELDMKDFIKTAPENSEEMLRFIEDEIDSFKDEDYRALCRRFIDTNREKLLYYPAAQKNHHSHYGGLLYHVKCMLRGAEAFCRIYDLNRDLLLTGVILHDMQKINEIDAGTDGIATGYSFRGQMLGHLMQGIIEIDRVAKKLGIPEEKYTLVEHMVLSHHYEPEFGSPKKPLFPEAEICHYLDIIDAKMYDMDNALASTQPGEFSEKIWTLDNRRIYKNMSAGDKSKEEQND